MVCARIQIPMYVAGRRVKVVPRYALGFHLDAQPDSGSFAFRISRLENCSRKEMFNQRESTMSFTRL